jgi:hypothetical protein
MNYRRELARESRSRENPPGELARASGPDERRSGRKSPRSDQRENDRRLSHAKRGPLRAVTLSRHRHGATLGREGERFTDTRRAVLPRAAFSYPTDSHASQKKIKHGTKGLIRAWVSW